MTSRRWLLCLLVVVVTALAQTATGPLSTDTYLKAWSDTDNPTVGIVDGKNAVFVLSHIPDPIRVHVYLNGLHQRVGLDYTISGKVITFIIPPPAKSTVDIDAEGRFTV